MPRDSAGNYSLPPGYLAVTGQTVLASQHNPPLEDLGVAVTASYVRDGRAPLTGNIPMNGYKAGGAANGTDPQDYVTLAQVQALLAAVASVPTGLMAPYTISIGTAPAGWLFANGQTVSRTTFAALWAEVQTGGNLAASEFAKQLGQYGPGDGSTTFTLPNLYADGGQFIRAIGSGRAIGTAQGDDYKSHNHDATVFDPGHRHNSVFRAGNAGNDLSGGNFWRGEGSAETSLQLTGITVGIGAVGGTETRPKNIAYPIIIKT